MVNINIQIPDDLHKKMKLDAVKQDLSLKEYIILALHQNKK